MNDLSRRKIVSFIFLVFGKTFLFFFFLFWMSEIPPGYTKATALSAYVSDTSGGSVDCRQNFWSFSFCCLLVCLQMKRLCRWSFLFCCLLLLGRCVWCQFICVEPNGTGYYVSLVERTLLTLAVLCSRNPPYIRVSDAVSPWWRRWGGGGGGVQAFSLLFGVSLPSSI